MSILKSKNISTLSVIDNSDYVLFENVKDVPGMRSNMNMFDPNNGSCIFSGMPNIDDWHSSVPTTPSSVFDPYGLYVDTNGKSTCRQLYPGPTATNNGQNFKVHIPSLSDSAVGQNMGYTNQKNITAGVSVKVYITDLTGNDLMIILRTITRNQYPDFFLSTDSIINLFTSFCNMSGPSNNNYGNCPLDRDGVTVLSTCPFFRMTNTQVTGGQDICQYFASLGISGKTPYEFTDNLYKNYCLTNKQSFLCDCLAAPQPGGYYSDIYQTIVAAQSDSSTFAGMGCWFGPCRDVNDRLVTSDIIAQTGPACPVPDCANICVNCSNGDKNQPVINQTCCSDKSTDPRCKAPPPPPPSNKTDYTKWIVIFIFISVCFYFYKHSRTS